MRWLSAEQTNSSLIVGNAAMVKLIRRVGDGLHPEAEMTRQLTKVGYGNAAPLLGESPKGGWSAEIRPEDVEHH